MTRSMPSVLLRLEGVALLAAAVTVYWVLDGSWVLFALLLLAPDLCFVALVAGQRALTVAYNVVHTLVGPLLLGMAAVVLAARTPGLVALIWLAHLGMDRAVGYGLKYSNARGDTHLGRV